MKKKRLKTAQSLLYSPWGPPSPYTRSIILRHVAAAVPLWQGLIKAMDESASHTNLICAAILDSTIRRYFFNFCVFFMFIVLFWIIIQIIKCCLISGIEEEYNDKSVEDGLRRYIQWGFCFCFLLRIWIFFYLLLLVMYLLSQISFTRNSGFWLVGLLCAYH